MIVKFTNVLCERELALHSAFKKLEPELRLIDPVCYATHLVFGHLPEVHDQIVEILDRHFKEFSFSFACTGEVRSTWDQTPIIALDFEFSFNQIFAFFRLVLDKDSSKVELHHISFENSGSSPQENTRLLQTSLNSVALN